MLLGFMEWSQGFLPIEEALAQIVAGFGVARGTLSRVNTLTGNVRIIASAHPFIKRKSFKPDHSFAHPVLGEEISSLKPGSLILMSQFEDVRSNRDPAIEDWMIDHKMTDIGLICLCRENNWIDFLELHFSEAPSYTWSTACDWGAVAFARTYKIRRPGLVTEALARRGDSAQWPNRSEWSILAPENVAGLTRSEWRVCVLVSRGLTAKAVANEIGVATSTVRTHLRNIYEKTSLGSYHQLARRLISPLEQQALHRGIHERSA